MIFTAALHGIEGRALTTTAERLRGLPTLSFPSLKEASARELRVRVHASLMNSDVALDLAFAVTFSPAAESASSLPNGHGDNSVDDGMGLDLPAALALAKASGHDIPSSMGAVGELSLKGDVRPVRGILARVQALRGLATSVIVAPENAREACLQEDVAVYVADTLKDALAIARIPSLFTRVTPHDFSSTTSTTSSMLECDLSDLRGMPLGARALEVAAAGSHNLLLVGPPGSGRTMLARRLPGLLPPLTKEEGLVVTKIHSAAGLNIGSGLRTARPFRAPHYSTSAAGLVGGGTASRPGELSLAHEGVLLLDELPEFSRIALEYLRNPLETGEVLLTRAKGSLRFPAHCLIVGTMLPCLCGFLGTRRCECSPSSVARHRRLHPFLWNAFDLRITVAPVDLTALDSAERSKSTAEVRARVLGARQRRAERGAPLPVDAGVSRAMTALARTRDDHRHLTRVSQTLADLEGTHTVRPAHVEEARALCESVEVGEQGADAGGWDGAL